MSDRMEEEGKPSPEVPEKATRRRFDADYKLRILEAADRCTEPGELGALLRREGLYSSSLSSWRRLREQGLLQSLAPKKRGRKANRNSKEAKELDRLRRENQRLSEQLRQAETIIEVQKKVSEMLGMTLPPADENNERKRP